ncbi:MAG: hypothetical protein U5K84_03610 [Alkalibacterium sp.]|nr:hypothetical protein [Alkalibacterium sp.]
MELISKGIFKEAGLSVLPYKEVKFRDWKVDHEAVCEAIEEELTYPIYVKPVNLGSSVGVTRTLNTQELIEAIELAFNYDYRVVVEKGVKVREIEVAILGMRMYIPLFQANWSKRSHFMHMKTST